ncbi:hypothetical protein NMY22_g1775 [Coprinellus aureogranulatus]|nr:hypothetical protein NMY22_g1775 [Coprinellus aureogranulatus]
MVDPVGVAFSEATKALLEAKDEGGQKAELGRIAQRLLELEAEIQVLRAHYNTKLPIAQLPSEVLCEIFVYVTLVEESKRETQCRFFMGQVCRRWRKIALDCTELWADISFDKPRGVIEAMIARSRDAPISIRNFETEDNSSAADLFYSVVSRTDRLKFAELTCDHGSHWIPEMLTRISSTAPVLEALDLFCGHEEYGDPIPPNGFLKGGAPLLKRLALSLLTRLTWNTIPFSAGLTHLSLTCHPDVDEGVHSHRPSLSSFLLSFAAMPDLQMVSLIGYLPAVDEPSRPMGFGLPALRHLKGLIMCDFIPNISAALPLLRVAHGTELNLKIFSEVRREDIPCLLHAVESLQCDDSIRWIGKTEVDRIQMVMPGFEGPAAKMQFWFTGDAEPSSPPKLVLGFSRNDLIEDILSSAIGALAPSQGQPEHHWNFSTTTSLEFCGGPQCEDTEDIGTLFDLFDTELPGLKKITFRSCPPAFTQFLIAINSTHGFAQPPFPALTHLECFDMGFNPHLSPSAVRSALSPLLSRGATVGQPIQELHCERSPPLDWLNLKDFSQDFPDTHIICDGYPSYERSYNAYRSWKGEFVRTYPLNRFPP